MSAAKESRRMAGTQLPRKRNTWSSLFLSFFSKQTTLFENLTSELSVSELKVEARQKKSQRFEYKKMQSYAFLSISQLKISKTISVSDLFFLNIL